MYEAYYSGKESVSKIEVKGILEVLNGGLSLRLYEYQCSPRLLEICLEFRPEKSILDTPTLCTNIERIRSFSYIDSRLFSDAFANVLIRWPEEEQSKVISLLATRVSSKCFAKTVELAIERRKTISQSIKLIRFVFGLAEQGNPDNSIEILETVTRLYKKYPGSLNESDFSNFVPLTFPNELLQVKSIELISTVFHDNPIALTEQVALIFAQLKGDFLRLKLNEQSVSKDAVKGLIGLFAKVLKLSTKVYSNYCDHEMMKKIQNWIIDHLTAEDEIEWISNDDGILCGLLLLAGSFRTDFMRITSVVAEFMNNSPITNFGTFLEYFLSAIHDNTELYKLFYGSIEKCFHELNYSHKTYSFRPNGWKLVPLMKIIVDNKRSEYNSVATLFFIAKIIVYTGFDYSPNNDFDLLERGMEQFKFTQFTELFAKMYWRSTGQARDYCMTLWLSSLKKKTALIPSQILQMIRAILECSEIKTDGNEADQVQNIAKEFLLDANFKVRLECGIVLGTIVRLLPADNEGINDLFEQFMKHAMKSGSNEHQSRVCYIMGLVTLKANLELDHIKSEISLSTNALIGLISSWNRENSPETRTIGREIAAASMHSLAFYIEKCGCAAKAEFYRDSCELLLEQVFMRDRCELMSSAILDLAKSLGLYVNLLPSQSQFITKTLRILMESNYLAFCINSNIDIFLEISLINPQIVTPSALIYKILKKSITTFKRNVIGIICQYLQIQINFDSRIAFELVDEGVFLLLLERANNPEYFNETEYGMLSLLVNKWLI